MHLTFGSSPYKGQALFTRYLPLITRRDKDTFYVFHKKQRHLYYLYYIELKTKKQRYPYFLQKPKAPMFFKKQRYPLSFIKQKYFYFRKNKSTFVLQRTKVSLLSKKQRYICFYKEQRYLHLFFYTGFLFNIFNVYSSYYSQVLKKKTTFYVPL